MKYKTKDAVKFSICTKLITRGSLGSSSHGYSLLPHANTGNYQPEDIVGISVNGKRYNRIPHDEEEIRLAASSQVRFVTDNRFHRNRSFNIGEREVADLLESLGYKCSECDERAVWYPSNTTEELDDEHPIDYFEAMHERLHDGY